MKKNRILQTLVLLFFVFTANAQRGINYKAIIKDGGGAAIVNTAVTVQFTILENGTTEVYKETHTPTTDANGIVIVNIGEGTVVSGVFNDIDWGSNPHFIKTEINTGSGLTDMGTTEFKTVPYAFHALKSSVSALNDLSDAQTDNKAVYIGEGAGNITHTSQNVNNVGIGFESLMNNYYNNNTAIGSYSLHSNTYGNDNTSLGCYTLFNNIGGSRNTAIGSSALRLNTTGSQNTAVGNNVLEKNTEGYENTAVGYYALEANTTGNANTAFGDRSLFKNTTGGSNTAVGYMALVSFTAGNFNTAIGFKALYGLTSGDNNIAIGNFANVPNSTGSNQIRMGNAYITYAGIQVAWTVTSDKRWKENIRSLPYGLDMLMKLKPVDYTRKNNEKKTREMGFIAQDIEKVLNEMGYNDLGLLTKDDDGYLHLRYNDFIALLTKAIQEQQAIINNLNDKLEQQEKNINGLKTELGQLNELDKRIKVIEEYQRVAEK